MTSPSASRARQRLLRLNHQGLLFEQEGPSSQVPRAEPPRSGELLDSRWRVGKQIGLGSFAHVFEASHTELPALSAAIKFCTYLGPNHERVQQVFLEESRVMCRLRGANTVRVYDAGQTESGLPYFVMEHLRGRTLESALSDENLLSAEYVEHVATGLLLGLSEIHDEGFIHRDIKPSNIFICSDYAKTVKILDFGLAHAATCSSQGGAAGTPLYAPPEYLEDPPSMPSKSGDVYSAALVLYELATGFHPFLLRGNERTGRHARQSSAPPAHELRKDIPAGLSRVLARGMELDPRDRPASARDLLALLEPTLREWAVPTREEGKTDRWRRLLWPCAVLVALFVPIHRVVDGEPSGGDEAPADARPDGDLHAMALAQEAPAVEETPAVDGVTREKSPAMQAPQTEPVSPSKVPVAPKESKAASSRSSSKSDGQRQARLPSIEAIEKCFDRCRPEGEEISISLYTSVVDQHGADNVVKLAPVSLKYAGDPPANSEEIQKCAFSCYGNKKILCPASLCTDKGQLKHTAR